MLAAIRGIVYSRLPDKREPKSASSRKREIAQNQKSDEARQPIALCHFLLPWPSWSID
jgi:hypothetical protein